MTICRSVVASSGVQLVAPWLQTLGLMALCDSTIVTRRNCSSVTSFLPRFFPTAGLSTDGVVIPAIDPNGSESSAQAPIWCPPPLVIPNNIEIASTILGGSCALPCRSITTPLDEWHQLVALHDIISLVSVIAFALQLIVYAFFPVARKQRKLVLFTLLALGIFLSNHIGYISGDSSTFPCADNSRLREDALCIGSAWTTTLFTFATVGVWLSFGKDLFIATSMHWVHIKKTHPHWTQAFDAFFVILLPFAISSMALASGALGAAPVMRPRAACLFKDPQAQVNLLLFPLLAYLTLGFVMLIISVRRLYSNYREMGKLKRSDKETLVLPLILLTLFLLVWGSYYVTAMHQWSQVSDTTANITAYVTCLLSTKPLSTLLHQLDPFSPVTTCELRTNGFAENMLQQAVVDGIGFFAMITFLASKRNRRIIQGFCKGTKVVPMVTELSHATRGDGSSKIESLRSTHNPYSPQHRTCARPPVTSLFAVALETPSLDACEAEIVRTLDTITVPDSQFQQPVFSMAGPAMEAPDVDGCVVDIEPVEEQGGGELSQ